MLQSNWERILHYSWNVSLVFSSSLDMERMNEPQWKMLVELVTFFVAIEDGFETGRWWVYGGFVGFVEQLLSWLILPCWICIIDNSNSRKYMCCRVQPPYAVFLFLTLFPSQVVLAHKQNLSPGLHVFWHFFQDITADRDMLSSVMTYTYLCISVKVYLMAFFLPQFPHISVLGNRMLLVLLHASTIWVLLLLRIVITIIDESWICCTVIWS